VSILSYLVFIIGSASNIGLYVSGFVTDHFEAIFTDLM
jgi:hypothetical protein